MANSELSAGRTPRRDRHAGRNTDGGGTRDRGAKPLDVICAGMYRACSTWQYTVAAHLVERHRNGSRLGYLSGEEYARSRHLSIREDHSPMGVLRERKTSGWTVFKSHDGDRFFARAVARRQAVVLYAYRDVRDVIFSLMHKRGQTFEQVLRQGMLHQILRNDRFWTRGDRVLIQKYEDLVAEPAIGVLQIARHLGIAIDPSEAAQIAAEYSPESNRARIASLQKTLRESGVDLSDESNRQICDPTTLLHWNHLRSARTETWRDLATMTQRRVLERFFGDWLEDRGYPRDDLRQSARATVHTGVAARISEGADIAQGWISCHVRAATLNHPGAARFAKRILGRGDSRPVGAVTWQDSSASSREIAADRS